MPEGQERNVMFKKIGLGGFALVVPSASFAQVDVTGAVAEITAAQTPIVAIGTAVIGVAVVMMIFKMIRGML